MEGGHGSNLREVRQRMWLPSRATGWATGLTRAQKRFATHRAAGVAREGSSSQLVPVDTFFPLSRILTFVLLMHWGLPCWGQRWTLECPVCPFPLGITGLWDQGHPGKLEKAERVPPTPGPAL